VKAKLELVEAPLRLDIACGQAKEPGWTGIDLAGDADIIHDLFVFPWPIEDDSVAEARISHFVEHIPHYLPHWNGVDGWWLFFDELYRICQPDATVDIVHPYAMSGRAFQDPTHVRYINETTWFYLDAEWRKAQTLDHYPVHCDFEAVTIIGTGVDESMANRSAETQAFGRAHYWNVVSDLGVKLRARK